MKPSEWDKIVKKYDKEIMNPLDKRVKNPLFNELKNIKNKKSKNVLELGCGLGRLASKVSKQLLRGEQIVVINAEKIIITGNPKAVIERYKAKTDRGSLNKGPFYPRYPDRLFRRVVRGMLPFKNQRGKNAYKKLKVNAGNPDKLEGEKIGKNIEDIKSKYITLKDLGKKLGAKLG